MPDADVHGTESAHSLIAQFRIDTDRGPPIYRQIVDQLKAFVASGRLRPGHAAPSVRALAAHLNVSPMTVSKAYGLLAREGILEHQCGLGMFVPRGRRSNGTADDRLALMERSLRDVVEQAARLRLPREMILEHLSRLFAAEDAPGSSTRRRSVGPGQSETAPMTPFVCRANPRSGKTPPESL